MIKAFYFDMDGTVVSYEKGDFHSSWDALGHTLCDRELWDAGTTKYYRQPQLYEEWIQYNARLLAGKKPDDASPVLFPGGVPPYNQGFVEFTRNLEAATSIGIVTSGIGLVASHICTELGLTFYVANELETAEGVFTGRVSTNVPLWKKAEIVAERARCDGLSLDEICFVGDNENDLAVLEIVGKPVLFVDRPERRKFAEALLQRSSVKELPIITDFRQLWDLL